MNKKLNDYFLSIKDKTVSFCGLGGSNLPIIKMFTENGISVSARDKRSYEQIGENAAIAEKYGAKLILGENYLKDITEDIIFRTPGMKYSTPELLKAQENGSEITSEIEMFFRFCPCKIYGITGSDGKTTTSTLISEMLKASGKRVHLGGNIGTPLFPKTEEIDEDDVAVVELSSFQLISMNRSPDVAVITNISPNHLDWHKDMQEYTVSKKNIMAFQNESSRCVLNLDNDITSSFKDESKGECMLFSRISRPQNGIYLRKDGIIVKTPEEKEVLKASDIRIPGTHNIENYMAAILAVWGDVSICDINKVAKEFPGVEHRTEFVREFRNVLYYNDSIGTSPTRTERGTLSLYDKKIILIAGGYDKNIPYDDFGEVVAKKVKVLILMGDTAEKIEKAVRNSNSFDPYEIKILRAENMEEAVCLASENACAHDIVSLSPASASFDKYKNFEARGRHFKEVVNSLK